MVRVKQITESQMNLTPTFTTIPRSPALRQPIAGARVLALTDDPEALGDVAEQLAADDVRLIIAPSVKAAQVRLYGQQPAAIILSAELEKGTGYALLETLREHGILADDVPAIAVSANAEPLSRVRALQRGCVDFLALPVWYPELVLRLQLAMTRNHRVINDAIEIAGGLRIDTRRQEVTVHGQAVPVSRLEYGLLMALARDPGRNVTKQELLRDVWGFEATTVKTRTLDSHACRLRVKLREAGGEYVVSIWGQGYRLTP